jgi:RimJ/RimL family protein N-acetyltransferase
MTELILYDRERVADWVAGRVGQRVGWEGYNAFGVEQDGQLISGVVIHQINGANAFCHIAVDKPTKKLFELFTVIGDYCFRQIGLKRLTGLVPSNEPEIVKFDIKLGFEVEAILKDAAVDADLIVLVMRADKCRWLPKGN